MKKITKINGELTKTAEKKTNDFLKKAEKARYVSAVELQKVLNREKTTDVIKGDIILWIEPVFSGYTYEIGEVIKENYSGKGQHTFSIKKTNGKISCKKGRTIFKECCILIERKTENEAVALKEKHARGLQAKKKALEIWLLEHAEFKGLQDVRGDRYAEKERRLNAMAPNKSATFAKTQAKREVAEKTKNAKNNHSQTQKIQNYHTLKKDIENMLSSRFTGVSIKIRASEIYNERNSDIKIPCYRVCVKIRKIAYIFPISTRKIDPEDWTHINTCHSVFNYYDCLEGIKKYVYLEESRLLAKEVLK